MTEQQLSIPTQPMREAQTDRELVDACRTDRRAFGLIYDRYLPQVYRYLFSRTADRQMAEDLTSQTFITAIEKFDRYRDDGHLAAWLITIARNKAYDAFRQNRRLVPIDQIREPDIHPDLLQNVIQNTRRTHLHALLAKLPEDEQDLMRLRFAAGISFGEIAVITRRTEEAVKKHTYRIIARLKSLMEEDHD